MASRSKRRSRSRTRSRCKRGEILKSGYRTKRGVRVSPTCIKDRGAKGKGPKVIPQLKTGMMMGYSTYLKQSERRKILDRLLKTTDYATVIRRLNAIRTLQKRTSPTISKKIGRDMRYLQKRYGS